MQLAKHKSHNAVYAKMHYLRIRREASPTSEATFAQTIKEYAKYRTTFLNAKERSIFLLIVGVHW